MKASVYIATSLDGYIARKDGNLDWLDEASATVSEGEDCGYARFMESVDVLVMGRKSYEKVLSFGQWPYGETPVIVMSRQPVSFPSSLPKHVSHSSESPEELLTRLANEGMEHAYIDGGAIIQSFLRDGLINQMIITTIPILLGVGIPLFGSLDHDIKLTHIDTTAYEFGFVQNTYMVN